MNFHVIWCKSVEQVFDFNTPGIVFVFFNFPFLALRTFSLPHYALSSLERSELLIKNIVKFPSSKVFRWLKCFKIISKRFEEYLHESTRVCLKANASISSSKRHPSEGCNCFMIIFPSTRDKPKLLKKLFIVSELWITEIKDLKELDESHLKRKLQLDKSDFNEQSHSFLVIQEHSGTTGEHFWALNTSPPQNNVPW